MTTSAEIVRSVGRTIEFLRFLAGCEETFAGEVTLTQCRTLPNVIRREAKRLLRHYPLSLPELRAALEEEGVS